MLDAICPANIQKRLWSDIFFAYSSLKKDYSVFMKHCLESADAFKRVINRPPGETYIERSGETIILENNTSKFNKKGTEIFSTSKYLTNTINLPPCPFHKCASKRLENFIKDFLDASSDQKFEKLTEFYKDKPSKSTRSKTAPKSEL